MNVQRRPEQLNPVSLSVSAGAIHAYADLTGDFNPIHVDPEFARGTPMRGVIAHGTLSLNLLWQSLARTFGTPALCGASLDVRFVKPVRVGDCVTAQGRRVSAPEGDYYEVWVATTDGLKVISGTFQPAPAAGGEMMEQSEG